MKSLYYFPLFLFFILVSIRVFPEEKTYGVYDNHILTSVNEQIVANDWLSIEDVAPQLPAEGRIPVIMVHGWSFNGKPAAPGTGYWDFHLNFLLNDPEMSKYFKPYYVRYWSNAVSVNELGGLLRDKIQAAGLHEKPFIMIAHSMGGLVSRSFMNEHVFTTGKYAGVTCGELVKLLITLGTPHHGSPMANGPARDEKVSFLLRLYMSAIESTVFSDTKYNEVNRSDLRWDNYDNLLNYTKYPAEKNEWLANLNSYTQFDPKLICYAAAVTGQFLLPPYTTTDEQYKVGAYVMSESFGFDNDGIVPYQSAVFERHTPKKIRFFNEYNHTDIAKGKGDDRLLFTSVKEDFLEVVPPKLIWPAEAGLFLKHSQIKEITWDAPSSILAINIYFSGDNGNSFTKIAENIDASLKTYSWLVPDTNLTQCLIKITKASDESLSSQSAAPFAIYHNRAVFLAPLAKGYFAPERKNMIQWNQAGIATMATLIYSDPQNGIEKVIAENVPVQQSVNSIEWQPDASISISESGFLLLRLNGMEIYGDSENYQFVSPPFTMLGLPQVSVITPSDNPTDIDGVSGEKMEIGANYTVRWRTEGEIKFVKISLCDSARNIIQEVRKKNHNPGIQSEGSFSWKIPGLIGNKFYLRIDAGRSEREITASCFTPYSFRINRQIRILSPSEQANTVELLPCFSVQPVDSATAYCFELTGPLSSGVSYKKTFTSDQPEFCLPNTVDDELLAGNPYRINTWAMFGVIRSYAATSDFNAESTKPYPFRLISPVDGDTLWEDNVSYLWQRSVGANSYRLKLVHQGNLIVDENLGRLDTILTLLMNKKGYTDTLFWNITAENDFGETSASGYFFNKDHAEAKKLIARDELNFSCYPNPVSSVAFFEFNVAEKSKGSVVSLSLLNLSGQQVCSLYKGVLQGGVQKFELDTNLSKLKKGMYFSMLEVDGRKEIQKIIMQ